MSSRHVRKVLGEDDLMVEPASEDEKPIVFNTPRKGFKNPYELVSRHTYCVIEEIVVN